jgi:RNA polymerase sigma-70 factor, ECF subfamily
LVFEDAPLVLWFLPHAQPALRDELASNVPMAMTLHTQLEEAWQQGKTAWPSLSLPVPLFVQHLAERTRQAASWADLSTALRSLSVSGLYLACACVHSIGDGLQRFDQAVIQRIPAFLSSMRVTNSFAEDVQQEVRRKLLVAVDDSPPGIAAYSGRGELANWVRAAAVRTALSMRRNKNEQNERDDGSIADRMAEYSADPVMESMKRQYGPVFKRVMQQIISGLSAESRTLLRMYYVDGVPTTQLGVLFGLNQSSMSRKLIGIRGDLFQSAKRQLKAELRLSDTAFEEISALVQSQLDLSLSRILKD